MPIDLTQLLDDTGSRGLQPTAAGTAGDAPPDANAPSWWDVTGGAALAKTYQDPLVHFAVGNETWDKEVADVQYRTRNSTVAQISGVLGAIAPALVTGLGAFALGRTAATAGAEALLPSAAKYAAQTGLEAAVAKPAALRGAEILGGSLASGAEQAVRGKVEGDTNIDAFKRGALAAGLVGGTEGVLWGAGKLLLKPTVGLDEVLGRTDPVIAAQRTSLTSQLQLARDAITQNGETPEALALQSKLERHLAELPPDNNVARAAEAAKAQQVVWDANVSTAGEKIVEAQTNVAMSWITGDAEGAQRIAAGMPKLEQERNAARTLATAGRNWVTFLSDPASQGARSYYYDIPNSLGTKPITVFGVSLGQPVSDTLRWLKISAIESPESAVSTQGVTTSKMLADLTETERQRQKAVVALVGKHTELWQQLADQTGNKFDATAANPTGTWGLDFLKHHETPDGINVYASLEQAYGTDAAQTWRQIVDLKDQAHALTVSVGAEPAMSDARMAGMGVKNHWPQYGQLTGEEITDRAILATQKWYASTGRDLTYEQARGELVRHQQFANGGARKFGSLDFQRQFPGTTADKLDAYAKGEFPFPVEADPYRSGNEYFSSVAHRLAYAPVFGPMMELKPAIATMAKAEGANPATVNTILDHLLGTKHYDEGLYKIARTINNLQVLEKMSLGVFQNSLQTFNNPMAIGARAAIQGFWNATRGTDKELVAAALGIAHGSLDSMQEMIEMDLAHRGAGATMDAIQGVRRANPLDNITRASLQYTGFSPAEAWNRNYTASSAAVVIRDTIGKAVLGNLRGENFMRAERMLDQFGINLRAVTQSAQKLGVYGQPLGVEAIDGLIGGANGIERAMWKATQQMQFLPGTGRMPLWWDHPIGKVAFQFKSFAFNQTKLIRDAVLREAAAGHLQPLAYYLSVYPAVGMGLNQVMGAFGKRNADTGIGRYFDALMAMGGFGMASTFTTALHFRDPRVLLGPGLSDIFDLFSIPFQDNKSAAVYNTISRLPAYRLGRALAGTAAGAAELGGKSVMEYYQRHWGTSGAGAGVRTVAPMDLRELLGPANPSPR